MQDEAVCVSQSIVHNPTNCCSPAVDVVRSKGRGKCERKKRKRRDEYLVWNDVSCSKIDICLGRVGQDSFMHYFGVQTQVSIFSAQSTST